MSERDNSKRISPPTDGGVDLPKTTQQNSIFQFWNTSTEYVKLPSGGVLYDDIGETIEIKQMTAYHEDILSNRAYILEGTLFDKFISAITVEDIDPAKLLAGDRTAILMAARSTAYGEEYNAVTKCPVCSSTNKVTCHLREPDLENQIPGSLKVNRGVFDEDIRTLLEASVDVNKKTITIPFPDGNIKVVCKLMDGYLEKSLFDYGAFKKKNGFGELNNFDQMLKVIVSINDITSRDEIENLLRNMPASAASYWRSAYKQLNPSIEIEINQKCKNEYCDHIINQEVGLSPEFFWPRSPISKNNS